MTRKISRFLRRYGREFRGPIAYIVLVGLSLAVFVGTLHSCQQPAAHDVERRGVQIFTE